MNVGAEKSMQRPLFAASAFALCAILLAGCADFGRVAALKLPPVNPESPVAAQVQAAADRDYPYPSFRDVPSKPKDLPTAGQVKSSVAGLVQNRIGQERWAAANPPMVSGGQAFAAEAQARVPVAVREVPPPDQAARSEAAAAQLRAAAAAPPPISAGAPPITPPMPPAYLPAPAREPPIPAAAPSRKSKKKFRLPPPPASAPRKRPA
jgi:hypothetical protein